MLAGVPIGAAMVLVFQGWIGYLGDCYRLYSSSAVRFRFPLTIRFFSLALADPQIFCGLAGAGAADRSHRHREVALRRHVSPDLPPNSSLDFHHS